MPAVLGLRGGCGQVCVYSTCKRVYVSTNHMRCPAPTRLHRSPPPLCPGCPTPEEVGLEIAQHVKMTRSLPARYLMRLLPVSLTCFASAEELAGITATMVETYFGTGAGHFTSSTGVGRGVVWDVGTHVRDVFGRFGWSEGVLVWLPGVVAWM